MFCDKALVFSPLFLDIKIKCLFVFQVTVFATPVVTAAIVHFFTQNIVDTVQFLMGKEIYIFFCIAKELFSI